MVVRVYEIYDDKSATLWLRVSWTQISGRAGNMWSLVRDMDWTLIQSYRRRIQTEEKAKVVAAVWWGTELIQFLAPLAILHHDDLKNRMNLFFSSNHPGAKQLAWQDIESILSPK